MSRSRRKTPAFHWCGNTNKISKRKCNRLFRRIENEMLQKNLDMPMKCREVFDNYLFNRDGKAVYIKNIDKKMMRK